MILSGEWVLSTKILITIVLVRLRKIMSIVLEFIEANMVVIEHYLNFKIDLMFSTISCLLFFYN